MWTGEQAQEHRRHVDIKQMNQQRVRELNRLKYKINWLGGEVQVERHRELGSVDETDVRQVCVGGNHSEKEHKAAGRK